MKTADNPTETSTLVAKALADLCAAQNLLKKLGVVRSQRIVSDFGEWFASRALSIPICESRTQSGWDLELAGRCVQVKTHAKAATNLARRTTLRTDEMKFDNLAILILTNTYLVREFYFAPRPEIESLAPFQSGKRIIAWNRLAPFAVPTVPRDLAPLLSPDTKLQVSNL